MHTADDGDVQPAIAQGGKILACNRWLADGHEGQTAAPEDWRAAVVGSGASGPNVPWLFAPRATRKVSTPAFCRQYATWHPIAPLRP